MRVWIRKPNKSSPYYQIGFFGLLEAQCSYRSHLIEGDEENNVYVNIGLTKKQFNELIDAINGEKLVN